MSNNKNNFCVYFASINIGSYSEDGFVFSSDELGLRLHSLSTPGNVNCGVKREVVKIHGVFDSSVGFRQPTDKEAAKEDLQLRFQKFNDPLYDLPALMFIKKAIEALTTNVGPSGQDYYRGFLIPLLEKVNPYDPFDELLEAKIAAMGAGISLTVMLTRDSQYDEMSKFLDSNGKWKDVAKHPLIGLESHEIATLENTYNHSGKSPSRKILSGLWGNDKGYSRNILTVLKESGAIEAAKVFYRWINMYQLGGFLQGRDRPWRKLGEEVGISSTTLDSYQRREQYDGPVDWYAKVYACLWTYNSPGSESHEQIIYDALVRLTNSKTVSEENKKAFRNALNFAKIWFLIKK